ncbi:flavin-containing monooxygenase [Mycobacteroides salmoniphilum]|uniref:FAD-containing monooxygenase EthA n=1 Tax=Mycobacteroides salmoniphilum TaxID=404941 RepID=A0A4R8SSP2_9MYCO|nr:NAD(P)/FAD-dependent oxidoreductase [Mycobacteroides salmoniphilum]TDZ91691.1 FAD-containing monooxygenase EthA [Mycobacteroides salmoniphilum]TEA02645.1 FAD-containing monooxygenase EthA [Mycobacteroides salmoniphilum]
MTEHVDIVIVGAGISGIGMACHVARDVPGKDFVVLEARERIGGTWDLFRYPGIRSDSDMFTLGFNFRPWTSTKGIADGASIREYVTDTAREFGVDKKIRFGHKVVGAEWSSEQGLWTVRAERAGEIVEFTTRFFLACTGYYNYDNGFTPEFEGLDDFTGQVIHPQHWPEDLDYAGKKVVVIGSGATAMTLVPAMAGTAGHVTMLQRSPTYVVSLPSTDALAVALQGKLPASIAYPIVKWKNQMVSFISYQTSRRDPERMKGILRALLKRQLPDFDLDKHFTPKYNPWDQRLCVVPDSDLFRALRKGTASIVTDRITRFTPKGILLESGEELEADIVVTATGLNVQLAGGLRPVVDGVQVNPADSVSYKGLMLTGLPNFVFTFGYTNASWTLRADLVSQYTCRLLNYMTKTGQTVVWPVEPPTSERLPFLEDLVSGYVARAESAVPHQVPLAPWRSHQNYFRELPVLKYGKVADKGVRFSRGGAGSATSGRGKASHEAPVAIGR